MHQAEGAKLLRRGVSGRGRRRQRRVLRRTGHKDDIGGDGGGGEQRLCLRLHHLGRQEERGRRGVVWMRGFPC